LIRVDDSRVQELPTAIPQSLSDPFNFGAMVGRAPIGM
jgi:hypothetical protein